MLKQIVVLLTILTMASCAAKQAQDTPAIDPNAAASADANAADPNAQAIDAATQRELIATLITLRRVHFAFDSTELTEASKLALKSAAESLAKHADVDLYVDGHSDERGTTEYNLGLGERRARSVVDYLVWLGVAPTRLHVTSFGEEQPLDPGHTDQSWAVNRRADFRLARGGVSLVIEPGDVVDVVPPSRG